MAVLMAERETMLTVDEAADRLRVHAETVRRWLRSGKLRGNLLSERAGYRIPASEVERLLTGQPPAD
jgi:excisionase family DNA binding protein